VPDLFRRPNATADSAGQPAFTEKQLEKLSRALKEPNASPAYVQLSSFASRKSSGTLGLRAALALGYYDYTREITRRRPNGWREPERTADRGLRLYWAAETDLASAIVPTRSPNSSAFAPNIPIR